MNFGMILSNQGIVAREKAKLCCMDVDSVMVYIKWEEIYVHIAKGVETKIWYFRLWDRKTIT